MAIQNTFYIREKPHVPKDGRVQMSNLDENIFSCFCMNITKYKRTKIENWKAHKQGSRPDASEDEMCPVHALHPYEGLLEGHSIYCNVFY